MQSDTKKQTKKQTKATGVAAGGAAFLPSETSYPPQLVSDGTQGVMPVATNLQYCQALLTSLFISVPVLVCVPLIRHEPRSNVAL